MRDILIRRGTRPVFNGERALEPPLGAEDRRSYQSELNHLVADPASEVTTARVEKWKHLLHNSTPDLDAQGPPIVRIYMADEVMTVGVSGGNILADDTPEPFTEELVEARLREELRRGNPPKASEGDVARDWDLLQKIVNGSDPVLALRSRGPQQTGSQAQSGQRRESALIVTL